MASIYEEKDSQVIATPVEASEELNLGQRALKKYTENFDAYSQDGFTPDRMFNALYKREQKNSGGKISDPEKWARESGMDSFLSEATAFTQKATQEKQDMATRAQNEATMGDASRGLIGGAHKTVGLLAGLGMLGSSKLIPGKLGEGMAAWFGDVYQDQMREASLYPTKTIMSEKDGEIFDFSGIKSLGDGIDWVQGVWGDLLPSMAFGLVSGGIGGVAAGAMAGAEKGIAANVMKGFVTKQTEKLVQKGLARESAEALAKGTLARQRGGAFGQVLGTAMLETGGNFAQAVDHYSKKFAEEGMDPHDARAHAMEEVSATLAMATGVASGLIERLGGSSRLLDSILGKGTSDVVGELLKTVRSGRATPDILGKALNIGKGILKEAVKQAPEEFGQEALQEISSLINMDFNDPDFQLLTPNNLRDVIGAGIAGFVGGGGSSLATTSLSGAKKMMGNTAKQDIESKMSVVDQVSALSARIARQQEMISKDPSLAGNVQPLMEQNRRDLEALLGHVQNTTRGITYEEAAQKINAESPSTDGKEFGVRQLRNMIRNGRIDIIEKGTVDPASLAGFLESRKAQAEGVTDAAEIHRRVTSARQSFVEAQEAKRLQDEAAATESAGTNTTEGVAAEKQAGATMQEASSTSAKESMGGSVEMSEEEAERRRILEEDDRIFREANEREKSALDAVNRIATDGEEARASINVLNIASKEEENTRNLTAALEENGVYEDWSDVRDGSDKDIMHSHAQSVVSTYSNLVTKDSSITRESVNDELKNDKIFRNENVRNVALDSIFSSRDSQSQESEMVDDNTPPVSAYDEADNVTEQQESTDKEFTPASNRVVFKNEFVRRDHQSMSIGALTRELESKIKRMNDGKYDNDKPGTIKFKDEIAPEIEYLEALISWKHGDMSTPAPDKHNFFGVKPSQEINAKPSATEQKSQSFDPVEIARKDMTEMDNAPDSFSAKPAEVSDNDLIGDEYNEASVSSDQLSSIFGNNKKDGTPAPKYNEEDPFYDPAYSEALADAVAEGSDPEQEDFDKVIKMVESFRNVLVNHLGQETYDKLVRNNLLQLDRLGKNLSAVYYAKSRTAYFDPEQYLTEAEVLSAFYHEIGVHHGLESLITKHSGEKAWDNFKQSFIKELVGKGPVSKDGLIFREAYDNAVRYYVNNKNAPEHFRALKGKSIKEMMEVDYFFHEFLGQLSDMTDWTKKKQPTWAVWLRDRVLEFLRALGFNIAPTFEQIGSLIQGSIAHIAETDNVGIKSSRLLASQRKAREQGLIGYDVATEAPQVAKERTFNIVFGKQGEGNVGLNLKAGTFNIPVVTTAGQKIPMTSVTNVLNQLVMSAKRFPQYEYAIPESAEGFAKEALDAFFQRSDIPGNIVRSKPAEAATAQDVEAQAARENSEATVTSFVNLFAPKEQNTKTTTEAKPAPVIDNWRTSPEKIDALSPNQVFVFGSNTAGIHGAGAALQAKNEFGAQSGKGRGMTGQTYALPTKVKSGDRLVTMPLAAIAKEVDAFIAHAAANPGKEFLVTAVGTGLAGYKQAQIAELFKKHAPLKNVLLPASFVGQVAANPAPAAKPAPEAKTTATTPNRQAAKKYVEEKFDLAEFPGSSDSISIGRSQEWEISSPYNRVVYGDHGPYIELTAEQFESIKSDAESQGVRVESKKKGQQAYYDEVYIDGHKFYIQRRDVKHLKNPPAGGDARFSASNNVQGGYADYKVGMVYVGVLDWFGDKSTGQVATNITPVESRPTPRPQPTPKPAEEIAKNTPVMAMNQYHDPASGKNMRKNLVNRGIKSTFDAIWNGYRTATTRSASYLAKVFDRSFLQGFLGKANNLEEALDIIKNGSRELTGKDEIASLSKRRNDLISKRNKVLSNMRNADQKNSDNLQAKLEEIDAALEYVSKKRNDIIKNNQAIIEAREEMMDSMRRAVVGQKFSVVEDKKRVVLEVTGITPMSYMTGDINAALWSKLEGWDESVMLQYTGSSSDPNFQITYRVISKTEDGKDVTYKAVSTEEMHQEEIADEIVSAMIERQNQEDGLIEDDVASVRVEAKGYLNNRVKGKSTIGEITTQNIEQQSALVHNIMTQIEKQIKANDPSFILNGDMDALANHIILLFERAMRIDNIKPIIAGESLKDDKKIEDRDRAIRFRTDLSKKAYDRFDAILKSISNATTTERNGKTSNNKFYKMMLDSYGKDFTKFNSHLWSVRKDLRAILDNMKSNMYNAKRKPLSNVKLPSIKDVSGKVSYKEAVSFDSFFKNSEQAIAHKQYVLRAARQVYQAFRFINSTAFDLYSKMYGGLLRRRVNNGRTSQANIATYKELVDSLGELFAHSEGFIKNDHALALASAINDSVSSSNGNEAATYEGYVSLAAKLRSHAAGMTAILGPLHYGEKMRLDSVINGYESIDSFKEDIFKMNKFVIDMLVYSGTLTQKQAEVLRHDNKLNIVSEDNFAPGLSKSNEEAVNFINNIIGYIGDKFGSEIKLSDKNALFPIFNDFMHPNTREAETRQRKAEGKSSAAKDFIDTLGRHKESLELSLDAINAKIDKTKAELDAADAAIKTAEARKRADNERLMRGGSDIFSDSFFGMKDDLTLEADSVVESTKKNKAATEKKLDKTWESQQRLENEVLNESSGGSVVSNESAETIGEKLSRELGPVYKEGEIYDSEIKQIARAAVEISKFAKENMAGSALSKLLFREIALGLIGFGFAHKEGANINPGIIYEGIPEHRLDLYVKAGFLTKVKIETAGNKFREVYAPMPTMFKSEMLDLIKMTGTRFSKFSESMFSQVEFGQSNRQAFFFPKDNSQVRNLVPTDGALAELRNIGPGSMLLGKNGEIYLVGGLTRTEQYRVEKGRNVLYYQDGYTLLKARIGKGRSGENNNGSISFDYNRNPANPARILSYSIDQINELGLSVIPRLHDMLIGYADTKEIDHLHGFKSQYQMTGLQDSIAAMKQFAADNTISEILGKYKTEIPFRPTYAHIATNSDGSQSLVVFNIAGDSRVLSIKSNMKGRVAAAEQEATAESATLSSLLANKKFKKLVRAMHSLTPNAIEQRGTGLSLEKSEERLENLANVLNRVVYDAVLETQKSHKLTKDQAAKLFEEMAGAVGLFVERAYAKNALPYGVSELQAEYAEADTDSSRYDPEDEVVDDRSDTQGKGLAFDVTTADVLDQKVLDAVSAKDEKTKAENVRIADRVANALIGTNVLKSGFYGLFGNMHKSARIDINKVLLANRGLMDKYEGGFTINQLIEDGHYAVAGQIISALAKQKSPSNYLLNSSVSSFDARVAFSILGRRIVKAYAADKNNMFMEKFISDAEDLFLAYPAIMGLYNQYKKNVSSQFLEKFPNPWATEGGKTHMAKQLGKLASSTAYAFITKDKTMNSLITGTVAWNNNESENLLFSMVTSGLPVDIMYGAAGLPVSDMTALWKATFMEKDPKGFSSAPDMMSLQPVEFSRMFDEQFVYAVQEALGQAPDTYYREVSDKISNILEGKKDGKSDLVTRDSNLISKAYDFIIKEFSDNTEILFSIAKAYLDVDRNGLRFDKDSSELSLENIYEFTTLTGIRVKTMTENESDAQREVWPTISTGAVTPFDLKLMEIVNKITPGTYNLGKYDKTNDGRKALQRINDVQYAVEYGENSLLTDFGRRVLDVLSGLHESAFYDNTLSPADIAKIRTAVIDGFDLENSGTLNSHIIANINSKFRINANRTPHAFSSETILNFGKIIDEAKAILASMTVFGGKAPNIVLHTAEENGWLFATDPKNKGLVIGFDDMLEMGDFNAVKQEMTAAMGLVDSKGNIHIFLGQHATKDGKLDMDELRRTVYHEGVGHLGARQLLGVQYEDFLIGIFNSHLKSDATAGLTREQKILFAEEWFASRAEQVRMDAAAGRPVNKHIGSLLDRFAMILIKAFDKLMAKLGFTTEQKTSSFEVRDVLARVFAGSQVAGRTGLSSLFSPALIPGENLIRYEHFSDYKENTADFMVTKVADYLRRWEMLQRSVLNFDGKIGANENFMYALRTQGSRMASLNDVANRLAKEFTDSFKGQIYSVDDISDLAHALHALERNNVNIPEHLDRIEKFMRDKFVEKLATEYKDLDQIDLAKKKSDLEHGIKAMRKKRASIIEKGDYTKLSGMSTNRANEIINSLISRNVLSKNTDGTYSGAAMKSVNKLIEASRLTLDVSLESGMINSMAHDMITGANGYKYFVPIPGYPEKALSLNQHFDIQSGNRFKYQNGSALGVAGLPTEDTRTVVGAVFAGLKNRMSEAAINETNRTIYNFIQTHRNAELFQTFVSEYTMEQMTNEYIKMTVDGDFMLTPEAAERELNAAGILRSPVDSQNMTRAQVKQFEQDNEMIPVYINGATKYFKILDKGLEKGLKNLNNPTEMSRAMRAIGYINRYLIKVNTSLNPEFFVPNMIRDMGSAINTLMIRENISGLKGSDIAKGLKGTIVQASKFLALKNLGRSRDAMTEEQQKVWDMYDEFEKFGGKIQWAYIESANEAMESINTAVRLGRGQGTLKEKAGAFANSVEGLLKKTSEVFENSTRLAVYMSARNAGMSAQEAALLSREITVDFDRRGEMGRAINTLYMFANAGIQGTLTILRAMKDNPGKAAKHLGAIAGLSMSMAIMGAFLGGDGDDEEPLYFNIPQNVRNSNMVIMLPGFETGLKIPLPYGYAFFWAVGQELANMVMGQSSAIEAGGSMMGAFLNNFNPLETAASLKESHGWVRMLSPTLVDPLVDIGFERTPFGTPLMPDKIYDGQPDSMRHWRTVSEPAKDIASAINSIGGTAGVAGYVSISPETLELLFEQATGGVGRFITKTIGTVMAPTGDKELSANDIPLFRRFTVGQGAWVDREKFQNNYEEIHGVNRTMKNLKDNVTLARNPEVRIEAQKDLAAFIEENKKIIGLRTLVNKQYERVKDIDEKKKALYKSGLDDAETAPKIRELDDKQRVIFSNFNRMFGERMNE